MKNIITISLSMTLSYFVSNAQVTKYGTIPLSFDSNERMDSATKFIIYGDTFLARNSEEFHQLKLAYSANHSADSLYSIYLAKRKTEVEDYFDAHPTENLDVIEDNFKKDHQRDIDIINQLRKVGAERFFRYRSLRVITPFPSMSLHNANIKARLFYENNTKGENNILSNYLLTISPKSNKVAIFTELYYDYFAGTRLGIGTLISNNASVIKDSTSIKIIDSSETQLDAIQRIIGGGGNIVVTWQVPLFFISTKHQNLRFLTSANPKASFDVPGIGVYKTDFTFKGDIGIESSLILAGDNGTIVFYGANRFAFIVGNKSFYKYLDASTTTANAGFFMNQWSLGLALKSQIRIGFTGFYGHPFVTKNFPTSVYISFTP